MPNNLIESRALKRSGHHENTFGFLRLLFALLVIISHIPEIHDGDRRHEILTQIFGTISFGEISVDAFFFISGYLITGSYLSSSTAGSYALKRIARIYPGFLVASLLCLIVVAPLGGGSLHISTNAWGSAVVRALLLMPPDLGTVFSGTYYPALDGPMWTISYEFRCYAIILFLGLTGVLARRDFIIFITITFLVLSVVEFAPHVAVATIEASFRGPPSIRSLHEIKTALIGGFRENIRLIAIFLTGSSYFLFKEKIYQSPTSLLVASLALCVCMFSAPLVNAGTAIFGGFLILAAAKKATGGLLERVNNEDDLSYGVYLYAWPITKLVFWWWPALPVLWAGIFVLLSACLFGWLSWRFVEKPAMTLLRKVHRPVRKVSI